MIRARVRVDVNRLSELKGRARRNAARNVTDAAERVAAEWRSRAPRRTGTYAATIRVQPSGDLRANVIADAKRDGVYLYPMAQEYGNRRTPARPAARPAAEGNEAAFHSSFRGLFD